MIDNSLLMLDFINRLSTFDENSNVWFDKEKLPLNFDDNCIIATDEEIEEFLSSGRLGCFLGIYQANDIVENVCQQDETYSSQQILEAINFYLQNDAFIEEAP